MEPATSPSDATVLSSAMALFDRGDYGEVLTLASGTTDPALMLLAARSYIATEKYDIAETLLRSLIKIIPNSSYLHGYLGDVLTKKGCNGAIAEYAEALRLDPDNTAAVRSYAEALIAENDLRSAIPALRAVVRADKKPEDVMKLEDILIKIGEPTEAVALHIQHFGQDSITLTYVEALLTAKQYEECLDAAHKGWTTTGDHAYLRICLEALSNLDPNAAEKAYREALDGFEEEDAPADANIIDIQFSYVLLEKLLGNYDIAKFELSKLLRTENDAIYHLVEADLALLAGNGDAANSIYRTLIAKEMGKDSFDGETAELIIDRFIAFLSEVRSKEEVAGIVSVTLSPYPKAICLAKIGEAYEAADSKSQAKDWYFRAYRADYISGGIAYAGYLKRAGEKREAETILQHIFTNTHNTAELETVADAVLNGKAELYKLDRSRELVQRKLATYADTLSSKGREMLAALYLYSAVDAIENRAYENCKWFCLAGIDVLPCYPENIHTEDFNDLLVRAKGRALSERPILMEKTAAVVAEESSDETAVSSADDVDEGILPNLDDREKMIIAFLREHREATETELRTILDTRNVSEIIATLMEKLGDLGTPLIEKRGSGTAGELYGYISRY
ncbi:MAG TPA: hypothetical protein O0X50_03230 [Methanocorpusculum sp.]|nr:hypothetical protein [Methanocorpusculum sp.]